MVAPVWAAVIFVAVNVQNGCSKVAFETQLSQASDTISALGFPSITINSGAKFTNNSDVQLRLESMGAKEVLLTNELDCKSDGPWKPYSKESPWVLGKNNQETFVYAKFRNGTKETVCVNASIIHDDVPPTVSVDTNVSSWSNVNQLDVEFQASDTLSGVDKLYCILPGQTEAVPCPGIYKSGALSDGQYLVQFQASDKAGNLSSPLPQPFGIDTVKPTVSINSGPATISGSKDASLAFTGADALSGVAKYECRLDDGAYSKCQSVQDYPGLMDGKHEFRVRAIDAAGNVSDEAKHAWSIDSSQPSLLFTQTPPPISNQNMATFAFEGKDGLGNALASFRCSLNGTPFGSCASPQTLLSLVEGTSSFTVIGKSLAGLDSAPISFSWLLDFTAPIVKIVSGPSTLTNKNSATFVFTATDSLSGIASVGCSLDGGAPEDCATLSKAYSPLAGNTKHTFQVIAVDRAGNSAKSAVYEWVIDNTPPELVIVSAPDQLSSSGSATFQLLATDLNGPISYMCRLDLQATFTPCGTTVPYENLVDGPHDFYAQAQDAAGNLSKIVPYKWTIETKGPKILFTQVPGSSIPDTVQGVIAYTITTGLSPVKTAVCTLNDKPILPCSTSIQSTKLPLLASGKYTFTVKATNTLGVMETASYTFNVTHAVITFPTIGSVAAVAFEDLLNSGSPDYDYNDFMTNFQVTAKVNTANQITDIYLDFYPRAVGAGYDHSFLLALSGTVSSQSKNVNDLPKTKALFNGAANIAVSYYDEAGKLLSQQAGVPYNGKDVVVFSSTHAAFGPVSGSINTGLPTDYKPGSGVPSNYIVAKQNARVHLALNNPALNPVPANGQFDVSTLRMILHVKDTDQIVDIIDVDPNNFTSEGYPWGFIIPTDWQWIQNGGVIDKGYPTFASYRQYLKDKNPACLTTPTCINWFKSPATGDAANTSLYPSIPFKPILPTP